MSIHQFKIAINHSEKPRIATILLSDLNAQNHQLIKIPNNITQQYI